MEEKIESLSRKFQKKLIEIYREIHEYPELSWQEERTTERVFVELKDLGLQVQRRAAKTGVVGMLEGKEKGKILGIRADLDALPIDEELTGLPYSSKNKGVMHACGHDAHIATVLGTAMILSELQSELEGAIKFIFQPSEEMQPSGALTMVKEGVLENPNVNAIIFGHAYPELEAGKIGIKSGAIMASSDFFRIIIEGEGGHAAYPHLSRDAVVSSASVIQQLQTIVSRRISPLDSSVLTVATVNGGSNYCTIAHQVEMTGTVRTFKEILRQQMPEIMEEIISGVTKAHGTKYQFKYRRDVPSTFNDPRITEIFCESCTKIIGKEDLVTLNEPQMGAEDFAFFLEKIPGIIFMLGVGNRERGISYPLHHPRFCIDEEALKIGSKVISGFALSYCRT